MMNTNLPSISGMIEALALVSEDKDFLSRQYLTPQHKKVNDLVAEWMKLAGMKAWQDPIGNIVGRYEGHESGLPALMLGSHLDTVVNAGKFDGMLGVATAIHCVASLQHRGKRLPVALEVIGFADEEGTRFKSTYLGSKAVAGTFDLATLDRLDTAGISMRKALSSFGLDTENIPKAARNKNEISAYVELHIEQGPVLEKKKIPLGIVTGIRGSFRFRDAFCKGEYLHSGATPYDYRKDSVVAVSNLVNEMNTFWKQQLQKRKDLVITFGQFFTDNKEHSFAKSSGLVNFCIDVRSNSKNTLEYTKKILIKKIKLIEKKTNTKFFLGKETNSEPALMDKKLIKKFQIYSKMISIKFETMASGAGHDASVFANYGIPSIMLFIRNKNGSHNPKEYMSIKNFMEVFKVLKGTIQDNYL